MKIVFGVVVCSICVPTDGQGFGTLCVKWLGNESTTGKLVIFFGYATHHASGRLADASKPIELLLGDDEQTCCGIAGIERTNRERQEIERKLQLRRKPMWKCYYQDVPGIVLYDEDWHPGVVGIAASRVVADSISLFGFGS